MTDIERSIELMENVISCMFSEEILPENKDTAAKVAELTKSTIIPALREKAEREKGCDGWISVKDRAPEVETEVFIFAVSPNGTVTKTTAIYEDGSVPVDDSMWSWVDMAFEYDETNGYNVIPEGWFEYRHYNPDDVYNNVVDGTVTHWQPLPEPPQ